MEESKIEMPVQEEEETMSASDIKLLVDEIGRLREQVASLEAEKQGLIPAPRKAPQDAALPWYEREDADLHKEVQCIVINLADRTVQGKLLTELPFHFRPDGAPPGEAPKTYRIHLNRKTTLPLGVIRHLQKAGYDQYGMKEIKNESGQFVEAYPVIVGRDHRFSINILG